MEYSISNSATTADQEKPNLPPGFRFHPTDEELVIHYLKKKATSLPLPVSIITEIDLYKYDPWELPAKATYGEQEWYFFSPRERKYPNGARPNRAANSGYWKATGTDKPVVASSDGNRKVGVKKALVFYGGKPPKGIKTNWIMHEYRLADNKSSYSKPPFQLGNKKNSKKLDDWVLCRIYKKNNSNKVVDHEISQQVIIGHGQNSNDISSTTTKPDFSLPLKLPSLYWEEDQYNGNDVVCGDNSSIASLLSQFPPLQQHTMQGFLGGDGVFRSTFQLPQMNWYS